MEVFVQMIPPVSLGVRQINTGFTLPELLRFLCEPEMFCLIVCQYFWCNDGNSLTEIALVITNLTDRKVARGGWKKTDPLFYPLKWFLCSVPANFPVPGPCCNTQLQYNFILRSLRFNWIASTWWCSSQWRAPISMTKYFVLLLFIG